MRTAHLLSIPSQMSHTLANKGLLYTVNPTAINEDNAVVICGWLAFAISLLSSFAAFECPSPHFVWQRSNIARTQSNESSNEAGQEILNRLISILNSLHLVHFCCFELFVLNGLLSQPYYDH